MPAPTTRRVNGTKGGVDWLAVDPPRPRRLDRGSSVGHALRGRRSCHPSGETVTADEPSDARTFMFTDIEGSTALWDQSPGSMAVALARHDRLIAQCVRALGGAIFTAGGDGFGAVFTSASRAATSATHVQRVIESEPWLTPTPLRVRVGLHTGTAEKRDGNYFGTTVNRAARVTSVGHGGQIVVSAVTASLLAEDAWTVVEMGRHRLDGFSQFEALFRLVADGVPDVARPLRSRPDLRRDLRASTSP